MVIIENSTGDIVSLLIFLFFFIAMPIIRANKKKQQNQQKGSKAKTLQEMIQEAMQPEEKQPEQEEESYQEKEPEPELQFPASQPQEKILKNEQAAVIDKAIVKSDLQLFMEEDMKQQEGNRIASESNSFYQEDEKRAFALEEETEADVTFEFDLKQAMIYHEILRKPRYFDY